MNFEVIENQFYKDGKPIKIISGAVHYFRNMPDTWSDIFKKMRAMGCNCVETYCVWNMHEKVPGEYDFSGMLNIAEFIKKADKEGLMVIVRPGPYICAEWEFKMKKILKYVAQMPRTYIILKGILIDCLMKSDLCFVLKADL